MSKVLRLFGIIAAVGAIGYVFFLFVVSPDFNNDRVTLTKDFIENIEAADICDTHFNPETKTVCTNFQDLIKGNNNLTYTLVTVGDKARITFTDSQTENEVVYEFTFTEEPNTGLSGFFHSTVYQIDLIE